VACVAARVSAPIAEDVPIRPERWRRLISAVFGVPELILPVSIRDAAF
jgi:hypothetical protein